MDQYLVEVRVPALGRRFDARLPNDITFGQAARLLWSMAQNLPDNTETASDAGNRRLYRLDSGKAWPTDVLIAKSDLRNGDQLLLF